jgi:protein SCO1/2
MSLATSEPSAPRPPSAAPPSSPVRAVAIAVIVAIAVLAVAAILAVRAQSSDDSSDGWGGQLLSEPYDKPDFTLTDTGGRAYDFRAATEGYVTLLFFGYTSCPDVCPLHMANIAAVLQEVSGSIEEKVKVVFVTTDPARDTPAVLRDWLDGFDASFVGLTGTPAQIIAAERAAQVPESQLEIQPADESYVVAHSSQVLAYSLDGQAHLVYPFGVRQSDWARDVPRLVTSEWQS